MTISSAQLFAQGIGAILAQQAKVGHTQQQVSSGKRIIHPADDPAAAKRLLDLDQALGLTRRFIANADVAANRLGLIESTLDRVANLLQRVRELAIQAGNPVLNAGDRQAIATEIDERLGELIGLANTEDGAGEHLFSGFSSHIRPFVHASGGGVAYRGDQGQRAIRIAPDFAVALGDSGQAVFVAIRNGNGTFATAESPTNTGTGVIDDGAVLDPAAWVPDTYTISFLTPSSYEVRDGAAALVTSGAYSSGASIGFNGIEVSIRGGPGAGDSFTVGSSVNQDLFSTIEGLSNALASAAIGAAAAAHLDNALARALTNLDRGMDHVAGIRARTGARLNAVDSERAVNQAFEGHLQELHAEIQDLDYAEALSCGSRIPCHAASGSSTSPWQWDCQVKRASSARLIVAPPLTSPGVSPSSELWTRCPL